MAAISFPEPVGRLEPQGQCAGSEDEIGYGYRLCDVTE